MGCEVTVGGSQNSGEQLMNGEHSRKGLHLTYTHVVLAFVTRNPQFRHKFHQHHHRIIWGQLLGLTQGSLCGAVFRENPGRLLMAPVNWLSPLTGHVQAELTLVFGSIRA